MACVVISISLLDFTIATPEAILLFIIIPHIKRVYILSITLDGKAMDYTRAQLE